MYYWYDWMVVCLMRFHGVEKLLAEQTASEEKQPSGAGVWAWNHVMLSLNAPLEASAACGISCCRPEHNRLDHVLLILSSLCCGVCAKQPDRCSRQKTYDTEIDGGTNSFTECPKIQSQTTFIQNNLCAVQLQRWRHTLTNLSVNDTAMLYNGTTTKQNE